MVDDHLEEVGDRVNDGTLGRDESRHLGGRNSVLDPTRVYIIDSLNRMGQLDSVGIVRNDVAISEIRKILFNFNVWRA